MYAYVLDKMVILKNFIHYQSAYSIKSSKSTLLQYGSHSFRRGEAYNASKKGIADCVIKIHSRWFSNAYKVYVSVDQERAGMEISNVI